MIADRLTGYTDAVLAGNQTEAEVPAQVPPELARAVQALAAHAGQAGAHTRLQPARLQRLKAEIMATWDTAHTPWWVGARREVGARLRGAYRSATRVAARAFTRQPAWSAAAALLLLAFGMLLMMPMGVAPVPGAAVGPVDAGLWVGVGVLAVAAAVVIGVRGRRGK